MRILLKSIAVFLLLSLYALVSLGIMALPASRARRLERLTGNSSFFARLGLRVLGIRVSSRREKRKGLRKRRTNYLIISNHLTYVDILVVASLMPSVFITSVELKQTFPLGLFAWLGGCLFVERRSPRGTEAGDRGDREGARPGDLGRVVPGRHDLERRHGAALQELAHYRGHHDRHQSPPGLHPLPGGQWMPGGPDEPRFSLLLRRDDVLPAPAEVAGAPVHRRGLRDHETHHYAPASFKEGPGDPGAPDDQRGVP